jgi:hypothetical protein
MMLARCAESARRFAATEQLQISGLKYGPTL